MSNLNLPNETRPLDNVICAGQPSQDSYREAARAGVTTVVNLRRPGETDRDLKAEVEEAGMTYVNIPVGSPDDLSRDNAAVLHEAIEAANGKVLVHCASSNRVGALLALRAHWYDGVQPEDALKLGQNGGLTGLSGAVVSLLEG